MRNSDQACRYQGRRLPGAPPPRTPDRRARAAWTSGSGRHIAAAGPASVRQAGGPPGSRPAGRAQGRRGGRADARSRSQALWRPRLVSAPSDSRQPRPAAIRCPCLSPRISTASRRRGRAPSGAETQVRPPLARQARARCSSPSPASPTCGSRPARGDAGQVLEAEDDADTFALQLDAPDGAQELGQRRVVRRAHPTRQLAAQPLLHGRRRDAAQHHVVALGGLAPLLQRRGDVVAIDPPVPAIAEGRAHRRAPGVEEQTPSTPWRPSAGVAPGGCDAGWRASPAPPRTARPGRWPGGAPG